MAQPRHPLGDTAGPFASVWRQNSNLCHYQRWGHHSSKWEAGLYTSRICMLAELPARSQIRGNGRQEADWECGTACYGKDPVGDGQGSFAEGGWSVVVCGAGNLETCCFGSLLLLPGRQQEWRGIRVRSMYRSGLKKSHAPCDGIPQTIGGRVS